MSEAHAPDEVPNPFAHPARRGGGDSLSLSLHVTDGDTIAELERYPDGPPRHDVAVTALRIGLLALRHARGDVDANAVRREGEVLIERLGGVLNEHGQSVQLQLATSLKEYFDPDSGRFNERVERLVRRDGDLEQVLRRQVGAEDSQLRQTLEAHLGESSPLMRTLDPEASRGLVASLSLTLDRALGAQRDRVLREFSLDNPEGALCRLVTELTEKQGRLGRDLESSIKELVEEFSLDDEDSALSRLVRRVERAQSQINREFSLDDESSALARMRRELLEVLDGHRKASAAFQQEVREALAAMSARRAEARRSTRHGDAFEAEVASFLSDRGQRAGDVVTRVGTTTGRIKNCKVGDCLVQLGPESAAAGARIVIEAKDSSGYTLAQALEELDTGRKNRDAGIGLFVFSTDAAPEGIEPLSRYGDAVIVTWDAEDPATDVHLSAGFSVARALSTRAAVVRETQEADFESIDRAIREIEKQSGGLEEIMRLTGTIRSNSDKILERTRIMHKSLRRQVEILDERIEDLEQLL